jgi:hypothetical protein
MRDIPNYKPEMHAGLTKTIQSGPESLFGTTRHIMACHYAKPEAEFPCAGWLANQIGPGNNLGMRLAVMTGKMPVPMTDGAQHERFEDTLSKTGGAKRKARRREDVPQGDTVMTEIKAVKDYARSGYASAAAAIKPWTVFVDRKKLVDKTGRVRRFTTERAAVAAARRFAP